MILPLLVVGNILQVCQSSSMKMLATKTTLDTFKGTTGVAITLPDRGRQFEGISVCLRFSLFECLDFQPLFGNSQFVLYQSGPHGLGVMQRKVEFSHKIQNQLIHKIYLSLFLTDTDLPCHITSGGRVLCRVMVGQKKKTRNTVGLIVPGGRSAGSTLCST